MILQGSICHCDHCRITARICKNCSKPRVVIGVADGSRTRYLRSHNPVLYLVSYSHHQEAQTESLPH